MGIQNLVVVRGNIDHVRNVIPSDVVGRLPQLEHIGVRADDGERRGRTSQVVEFHLTVADG